MQNKKSYKAEKQLKRNKMGKKKNKNGIFGFIMKTAGIAAAVYAGLFCIFYFDLDGKLLYYVVEPNMKKHYDNMERRDPGSVPYEQIDGAYMQK